ncbi:MAG TPA: TMEM175 family protein [Gaiellaceae bacterium]|nr:TMEM175 family protein [Gaiellaceae bacterium]
METTRLETFSDGIFAIAATLLILEIRLPGQGTLTHQLLHLWPSYVAYATSFVTIGIMWINHHEIFRYVGRANRTFLAISVLFLMVIAFIPFPTLVLARHLNDGDATAAAAFYGLTNVAMAAMFSALWFYAVHRGHLLAAGADQRAVRGISRSFLPGVPLYAVATATAFISSWIAVGLFFALAVFYVLESSLFARG